MVADAKILDTLRYQMSIGMDILYKRFRVISGLWPSRSLSRDLSNSVTDRLEYRKKIGFLERVDVGAFTIRLHHRCETRINRNTAEKLDAELICHRLSTTSRKNIGAFLLLNLVEDPPNIKLGMSTYWTMGAYEPAHIFYNAKDR